jgi:hypothetical protein
VERYLPVPVWNNTLGTWEPVDFRNGQKVTTWPAGFDPDQLPSPEYRDGDRVQFVRDETCARDGRVKMVMLQGGSYGSFEERDRIIEQRYCHPDAIIYIVTARNHDHQIRSWNILGRFLSLAQANKQLRQANK